MAPLVDLNKEIIFASSDSDVSHQISRLVKQGTIRKIAPRLYTSNLVDSPENIVRRNILSILMWRFPNTIISHRSANEMRITPNGNFFLTGNYNRKITDLPGVTIYILRGPAADEKDMVYGNMFIASEYRWLLENMQTSRKVGDDSKTLPIENIERKLENVLIAGGEEQLNQYRDTLRATAERLDMMEEFSKINVLISALLNTHSAKVLTSSVAKAMAAGIPYDEKRVELFEKLYTTLQNRHFLARPIIEQNEEDYLSVAFFESYFSNYIEGTEFEVEEARQIVQTGLPIPKRNEDSHDILGTYQVVSNRSEMKCCPTSAQELLDILQRRHAILLFGRPDLNPGHFKEKNNRAGNTEFVEAKRVEGTLAAGFNYYAALTSPLAKAIYMMFLISEVHPFNDGNGRLARIMMNAELFRAGEAKIIVPNVYREDYLLALRKLSRQGDSSVYIKVMEKLHHFSSTLYDRPFQELTAYLQKCNAFDDPKLSHLKFEK
ncbi:MAG: Fic family protein [Bacteroidales bacterium]|nr:Fic family protein [Bacteroidales bacterium]